MLIDPVDTAIQFVGTLVMLALAWLVYDMLRGFWYREDENAPD